MRSGFAADHEELAVRVRRASGSGPSVGLGAGESANPYARRRSPSQLGVPSLNLQALKERQASDNGTFLPRLQSRDSGAQSDRSSLRTNTHSITARRRGSLALSPTSRPQSAGGRAVILEPIKSPQGLGLGLGLGQVGRALFLKASEETGAGA